MIGTASQRDTIFVLLHSALKFQRHEQADFGFSVNSVQKKQAHKRVKKENRNSISGRSPSTFRQESKGIRRSDHFNVATTKLQLFMFILYQF